jgi:hypothetical protein
VVESGCYRRKQRLRTALRIVTPRRWMPETRGIPSTPATPPTHHAAFRECPRTRRLTDWRGPSPGFAGDCVRDSFKAVPRFGETVAKGSFCLPPSAAHSDLRARALIVLSRSEVRLQFRPMVIPILRNICEDLPAVDATCKARPCDNIYGSGKNPFSERMGW